MYQFLQIVFHGFFNKTFSVTDNVIYGYTNVLSLIIRIINTEKGVHSKHFRNGQITHFVSRRVNRFLNSIFQRIVTVFLSISAISAWNQNFMNFYDFFVI